MPLSVAPASGPIGWIGPISAQPRGMSIRPRAVRHAGEGGLQRSSPGKRRRTMRFMVMVKADKNSEAGVLPDEQLLAEMGRFNEELVKAGVMLAGDGLQPSSKGARVRFSGKNRTVIDGPFPETKDLIAGYWIWQVGSLQEAIEWVKKCPNPMLGESEIEIRQIFELEDFPAVPDNVRALDERLKKERGEK
jgi:hypothetical protein